MKNKLFQIVVAVLLVGLLLLLSDPFMLFMPPAAAMLVMVGVVVLMLLWGVFVLYEQAQDEREVAHRMYSGRIAYLMGIVILTTAFIVQSLEHALDFWIALCLAVMVLAKVVTHFYLDANK